MVDGGAFNIVLRSYQQRVIYGANGEISLATFIVDTIEDF